MEEFPVILNVAIRALHSNLVVTLHHFSCHAEPLSKVLPGFVLPLRSLERYLSTTQEECGFVLTKAGAAHLFAYVMPYYSTADITRMLAVG